ncbi:hypothetical protein RZN05_04775 [Sphingomonas sp. HF-S4]|uniref:Uncharacterized protein n=1 Tax=Sphingomonas agrestis TaxID=3080540 RepID=A0ABU3Y4F9_9SPHN|nr:hypothetical protein [Sphingomonas sp. HF-S4]MDV3456288.1 hypothetical protein [Sphingomonas sp. HF-S4]
MIMLDFPGLTSHFAHLFIPKIARPRNKPKDPAQGNAPGLPMGEAPVTASAPDHAGAAERLEKVRQTRI